LLSQAFASKDASLPAPVVAFTSFAANPCNPEYAASITAPANVTSDQTFNVTASFTTNPDPWDNARIQLFDHQTFVDMKYDSEIVIVDKVPNAKGRSVNPDCAKGNVTFTIHADED
jgi:ABC-type uncharacterized transport system substrate-binding protein